MSISKEVFILYLEHSDWVVCGLRLGHRLRLHQKEPTGNDAIDKYTIYWCLELPFGLEFAVHPPSKLVLFFKRMCS